MKHIVMLLLCLALLMGAATAESAETVILLGEDTITVDGEPITEDPTRSVYLAPEVEAHPDVPAGLEGVVNRTVTITRAGSYRISGTATDARIAVRAGTEDRVRLILDGVDVTCRTSSALQGYSAFDPRTAGEYGLTIELAEGSDNRITGSHTAQLSETDVKFDGAVDSLVSLGFEGTGSLTVEADNEGIEVKFGHLTINGGDFHIVSGDDPLNVSEDGVGVLTVNGGRVYSAVRPVAGGEGDGADSNGWIVFNGGTAINLAHPTSGDSGIDADMGSSINGGLIVGAGNMYDPIDTSSAQPFMMLEFAQATDGLVVVTDETDAPVFAYELPHAYQYVAFSSPDLVHGATYRVYLGGQIEGVAQDGLYTDVTAYTPGTLLRHGDGTASSRSMRGHGRRGFGPADGERPADGESPANGSSPADGENPAVGAPALPEGFDPADGAPAFPEGFDPADGAPAFPEGFNPADGAPAFPEGFDPNARRGAGMTPPAGGMGGRGLTSSAEEATTAFTLTPETSAFTNVQPAE